MGLGVATTQPQQHDEREYIMYAWKNFTGGIIYIQKVTLQVTDQISKIQSDAIDLETRTRENLTETLKHRKLF